ncbi:MAG: amidohydrolase family protein [Bacteroidetes bacterium]|nr:amidohydrolase family protein [Bacteroidota bacterium]
MKNALPYLLLLTFLIYPFNFLKSQHVGIENSGKYDRFLIKNVMLIDGKGTPMKGPNDVIVEKNKITSITNTRTGEDAYANEKHIIDGTGMYLLPGLINNHVHIHERPNCTLEYLYKLWLACGITTVRDVGSDVALTLADRQKSQMGNLIAPRILIYMVVRNKDVKGAVAQVREFKKLGADGIKIFGMDKDVMEAVLAESHALGLKVAHHVGVEETDARDDIQFGTATIEHWYGIPDAALIGSQNFPSWYNYNNENDRFRWAGSLWKEADPVRLEKTLKGMVDHHVAWIPTFAIYEANRDLQRAQNQPWFNEYLHPTLANYFSPSPKNHGSYHWNWTTTDEKNWKENYKIWMKAVKDYADMGGLVGAGEDAGFIYMMYGFTYIRELELMHEAGFHPIDVMMNATGNNAKILGFEDQIGRIKEGFLADLILVEGNPLENLKYLYPTGIKVVEDGIVKTKGGVKWTIKDGIVYDAVKMLADVKQIVEEAKKK